ncbi:MAG: hypothetical protein ACMXYL_00885 [Candidatus Woesearchaeota archaeon]
MRLNIRALLLIPLLLVMIILAPIFIKLTLLPVFALSLTSIIR